MCREIKNLLQSTVEYWRAVEKGDYQRQLDQYEFHLMVQSKAALKNYIEDNNNVEELKRIIEFRNETISVLRNTINELEAQPECVPFTRREEYWRQCANEFRVKVEDNVKRIAELEAEVKRLTAILKEKENI